MGLHTKKDEKIQLRHPGGKEAVRISREKYELLRSSLESVLRKAKAASHAELVKAVSRELKARRVVFDGSVAWYLEWVKLDMEARKLLKRLPDSSPQLFTLARK